MTGNVVSPGYEQLVEMLSELDGVLATRGEVGDSANVPGNGADIFFVKFDWFFENDGDMAALAMKTAIAMIKGSPSAVVMVEKAPKFEWGDPHMPVTRFYMKWAIGWRA